MAEIDESIGPYWFGNGGLGTNSIEWHYNGKDVYMAIGQTEGLAFNRADQIDALIAALTKAKEWLK